MEKNFYFPLEVFPLKNILQQCCDENVWIKKIFQHRSFLGFSLNPIYINHHGLYRAIQVMKYFPLD